MCLVDKSTAMLRIQCLNPMGVSKLSLNEVREGKAILGQVQILTVCMQKMSTTTPPDAQHLQLEDAPVQRLLLPRLANLLPWSAVCRSPTSLGSFMRA